jgi:hypothetical protein
MQLYAMAPKVLGGYPEAYTRLGYLAQGRWQPSLLTPGTWSHDDLCEGACVLPTLAADMANAPRYRGEGPVDTDQCPALMCFYWGRGWINVAAPPLNTSGSKFKLCLMLVADLLMLHWWWASCPPDVGKDGMSLFTLLMHRLLTQLENELLTNAPPPTGMHCGYARQPNIGHVCAGIHASSYSHLSMSWHPP